MRLRILILAMLVATPAATSPRKPSAPVKAHIEARPVPGGYEVTLVAVPTRDVPSLDLSIAGSKMSFGAVAANDRRELTTRVTVRGGTGLDVVGSASAGGRRKAALLRVGATVRRAPKPPVIHTLPGGRRVREVR